MRDWRTPRMAVGAMFLLNGSLFGAWASRIPDVVDKFGLSPGGLGLLLLCMAVGALMAFPLAGRLSDRLGAGRVARGVAVSYVLSFWLLAAPPTTGVMVLALLAFGATQGSLDVAMNAWGSEVEQREGRAVMSSFHAMFSMGAGLGAASGYFALEMDVGLALHFLAVGAVTALIALGVGTTSWQPSPPQFDGPAFALPRGPLVLVGLLVLCATLGEGALAEWSAVFLRATAGTTPGQAALGYAVFSAAMVMMRLIGDKVVNRVGPVRSGRISGLIAATGAGTIVVAPHLGAALAGFALMGVGYALLAPLAFSRAGADPDVPPGRAIASMATFGYGGLLLGPPLIGFVAAGSSIAVGFGALGGLAALVVVLSSWLVAPGARHEPAREGIEVPAHDGRVEMKPGGT